MSSITYERNVHGSLFDFILSLPNRDGDLSITFNNIDFPMYIADELRYIVELSPGIVLSINFENCSIGPSVENFLYSIGAENQILISINNII